jgi:hypothetical protein
VRLGIGHSFDSVFAEKVLNKGHDCGTMLELRLNITESKILNSYKNNENIKYKVMENGIIV